MNIKENAQAIVKECERVERVEKLINKLNDTTLRNIGINFDKCRSSHGSMIYTWDIPLEDLEEIKEFMISKLKKQVKQ